MRRFLAALCVLGFATVMLLGCEQPPPPPPTVTPQAASTAPPIIVPTTPPTPTAGVVLTEKRIGFPKPGEPITVIVSSPVGSIADSSARLLAPLLEMQLGVPVHVDNRTGPAGECASAGLADLRPDGYTLIMFSSPHTLATYLDPACEAPYSRADFAGVAGLFVDRLAIVVRTESSFAVPRDVVDYARANPGDFAIGTTGNLSGGHLAALAWARQADVNFAFFPFPSGIEAISRLLIDRLDAAAVPLSSLGANVKVGTIRLLGIMDDQESPLVPGVPTFASQGYGVTAPAYYFLVAPAGTPSEVVKVLSGAVRKAAEEDGYRMKLAEIGAEVKYMAPAELEAYWTERENWARPLLETRHR